MRNDNREEDGEMASGLTVEQHDVLRGMLDDLPDTVPPRAVWERIESQAQAEGLLNRPFLRSGSRWLAGSGIAAAVVLAVLGLPGNENLPEEMVADDRGTELRTEPAYDPKPAQSGFDTLNALRVQSQLLERDLRSMPSQPRVQRAGTLATIDDLQDRIAAIDLYLSDSGLSPEAQEIYWRERVRLMDSLVRLRYAQTQRMSF